MVTSWDAIPTVVGSNPDHVNYFRWLHLGTIVPTVVGSNPDHVKYFQVVTS